jgi:death-on-curing protein
MATSGRPALARVVFLDLNQHAADLDRQAACELLIDTARGAVDVEDIASPLGVVPRTGR